MVKHMEILEVRITCGMTSNKMSSNAEKDKRSPNDFDSYCFGGRKEVRKILSCQHGSLLRTKEG